MTKLDLRPKMEECKRKMSVLPTKKLQLLENFPHLHCKWMRPFRDVFVACWNKEKVSSILGEDSDGVGTLAIKDRPFCRGVHEDVPDCHEPIKQRCIDKCKHYFKGGSRYTKLMGFCTKNCHDFELFEIESKLNTGRTKVIEWDV